MSIISNPSVTLAVYVTIIADEADEATSFFLKEGVHDRRTIEAGWVELGMCASSDASSEMSLKIMEHP